MTKYKTLEIRLSEVKRGDRVLGYNQFYERVYKINEHTKYALTTSKNWVVLYSKLSNSIFSAGAETIVSVKRWTK